LAGAAAQTVRITLLGGTRTLPVRTAPLVISRTHGATLTVLAGKLAGRDAQLLIVGPGYRATAGLKVSHSLAGAVIKLPKRRQHGRWFAGILDYHGVHTQRHALHGKVLIAAATWTTR
jgi:hypothetical protein